MTAVIMIILTGSIYLVFLYVPVKCSPLSGHHLMTISLFRKFFSYSPLSFGETKAQEVKICPRTNLAKTNSLNVRI